MLDRSVKHFEDWEEWGEASTVPEQCIVFELLLDCLKKLFYVLGYSKMHEVYNFFKCIIELLAENESWHMLNKLCYGRYLLDFWHIPA